MGPLMTFLAAGLVFHATHILLSSTGLRGILRDLLGEDGYLATYSLIALATFIGFVAAYTKAPLIILWDTDPALRLVPLLVMPVAAILLIAGYTTPNPTMLGMEQVAANDDPAPGILRVTRHPVLWAVGLWALSHIPPNGDLASLFFFGSLAALALGGTFLVDAKKRLALGTNWPRLAAITSNLPFLAILTGRTRLRLYDLSPLRIVAGLLLYAVLLFGHPLLTGYPALPW